jgi:hypothetical protein
MLENTFKFYIPQFWEIKNKLRVENPKAQSHKSLSKDDASAPCPRWTVSPSNGSQTTKSGPSWRSPWSLKGLGYFRQPPVSQRSCDTSTIGRHSSTFADRCQGPSCDGTPVALLTQLLLCWINTDCW